MYLLPRLKSKIKRKELSTRFSLNSFDYIKNNIYWDKINLDKWLLILLCISYLIINYQLLRI